MASVIKHGRKHGSSLMGQIAKTQWQRHIWVSYFQINKAVSEHPFPNLLFFTTSTQNSRFILWGRRRKKKKKKKKSISAKFINGFLRSMRVHSEGLAGTRFIPVNVLEGELPLMLFSFPLGSKSMWVLSRPGRHTGGTSSSLLFLHAAPGLWRGEKDSSDPHSHCQVDSNLS